MDRSPPLLNPQAPKKQAFLQTNLVTTKPAAVAALMDSLAVAAVSPAEEEAAGELRGYSSSEASGLQGCAQLETSQEPI